MVAVPRTLCARIPDAVSDECAAFAVVGAIGLQGIRLAAPTLGESFVVIGWVSLGWSLFNYFVRTAVAYWDRP